MVLRRPAAGIEFTRRTALLVLGASGAVIATLDRPQAAIWPQRPVRIICLGGAGTGMDAAARSFAEVLGKTWEQSVVIDNRPGADGILAIEALLSASDGHTLLYGSQSMVTMLPLMYDKLSFDPARDLVPISFVVEDFIAIAASPVLPVASLADLVRVARDRPGALNYVTSPGYPYLAFSAFQTAAGIKLTNVPYRGVNTAAVSDLMQDRIQIAIVPLGTVLGQAQSGQLKLLAIVGPRRSAKIPHVPTGSEAGYPELTIEAGNGLYGPRGLAPELADRIARDLLQAMGEPQLQERLNNLGYVPRGSTPAQFAAALGSGREHWAPLAKIYGARPSQ
jgi:tripartite-type tricarboxylate transporter receptor subunit TctC